MLKSSTIRSLLAESVTDPSEKMIVIVSVNAGVISKAYSRSAPVRLLALPFSTLMLSAENPLTGSLKVMDIGIGDIFVGGFSDYSSFTIYTF